MQFVATAVCAFFFGRVKKSTTGQQPRMAPDISVYFSPQRQVARRGLGVRMHSLPQPDKKRDGNRGKASVEKGG